MGGNPHVNADVTDHLALPDFTDYALEIQTGQVGEAPRNLRFLPRHLPNESDKLPHVLSR